MNTKQNSALSPTLDLRHKLDQLRHWYGERTDYVNQQSIWLFVATLGCWSVSQPHLRLLSLALTLFIYFYLAVYGLRNGSPSRELRSSIEADLASQDISAEEKRARSQEYSELETSVMSAANFKRSWLYWLTLSYWFASAVYFIVGFIRLPVGAA